MKIYFDTEFEGLFPEAGLISIGLTNASGTQNFYAELSDSYSLENCSAFCKSEVIPMLEGGLKKVTTLQLRKQLWEWLENQGETEIVCDSKRDVMQIKSLFPEGIPPFCECLVLGFWSGLKRKLLNRNKRIYKIYNLRSHHSLDDAIVNRIIFEGK